VFGFGEHTQVDPMAAVPTNSNQSLPLEYFINRLYVAVSRPKRRLIIVDGKEGREHLWKFAMDANIQREVLRHLHGPEVWEGKVAGMVEGMLEHFDTDESTDFEEEAKNLKAQGLSQKDPYLLRSAANRYRLAGFQGDANYCLAEALFVDEKFLDAGKAFADCGQHDRAMDAFWRAGRPGDKSLLELSAAKPELQTRLEHILAKFLNAPRDYETGYRALATLAERSASADEAVAFTAYSFWTEPTRRVAEKIVELGEKQRGAPDWKALSELLNRLDSVGFGLKTSLLARVCFLAEEWAKAVSLWESANDKSTKEYREAKARVAPYPEQLTYLKELGKNEAILEAFKSNPDVALEADSKRIVGAALISAKRFAEALEQLAGAGSISDLADLAAMALANDAKEIAAKSVRLCAVISVQQSHWGAIREYFNSGHLPRASKETQKNLAPLLKELKWDFECLLVACFARSDSLTKLDSSEQKPLSKFLRDLDRNCDWRRRLSTPELGAAIERCQRYVDAVEFYESAMTATKSDEEKRFAIVRWLISKQRLETFYRGEKQYRKADDTKAEWEKVKTTHQVQDSELAAEYPELDTLTALLHREAAKPASPETLVSPAQRVQSKLSEPTVIPRPTELPHEPQQIPRAPKPDAELALGQLKLRLSRENQRINIEHQGTSMTATIRLSPIRCTSEDVTWKVEASSQLAHRCEEWGLVVDFSRLDTDRLVIIRLESAGVEVSLKTDT